MNNTLFINGQNEWVAGIFEKHAPAEYLTNWIYKKAPDEDKLSLLRDTEFLVLHPASISGELMQEAKKLRLIQLLTAGYDQIDIRLARELGVPVATNGGANAVAVAEHTVALLLTLYRRVRQCDNSVRQGTWRKPINGFNTFEVAGKTLGLIGAGMIGYNVARRLAGFEIKVIYYDITDAPKLEKEFGAQRISTVEELLQLADIVSLHVPATPETYHMINRDTLALMKPGSVLLNTSRGTAIDEWALFEALKKKKILGAGLDVFENEPVDVDNPLLRLENAVVTPHIAGHAYEGWFRRIQFAWENIQRVVDGKSPESTVSS